MGGEWESANCLTIVINCIIICSSSLLKPFIVWSLMLQYAVPNSWLKPLNYMMSTYDAYMVYLCRLPALSLSIPISTTKTHGSCVLHVALHVKSGTYYTERVIETYCSAFVRFCLLITGSWVQFIDSLCAKYTTQFNILYESIQKRNGNGHGWSSSSCFLYLLGPVQHWNNGTGSEWVSWGSLKECFWGKTQDHVNGMGFVTNSSPAVNSMSSDSIMCLRPAIWMRQG